MRRAKAAIRTIGPNAYMVVVSLADNVLKPLVFADGLTTPMPITFVGVIGGTIAYGISGLFLGPIVLAVAWALLVAWIEDSADRADAKSADPKSGPS